MVKRCLIAVLALWAGVHSACYAGPDWRQAGGDLFVSDPQPAAGISAGLPPLSQPFTAAVTAAAAHQGLDPKLLHALVIVESGYRPNAVSSAGAGGLTQLMPATARSLGVEDRFNPAANLEGGAQYLAAQLLRFGDLRLALAAFNAGPERVARLGRVPAIPETERYVEAVIACFLALAAGRQVTTAKACASQGE